MISVIPGKKRLHKGLWLLFELSDVFRFRDAGIIRPQLLHC